MVGLEASEKEGEEGRVEVVELEREGLEEEEMVLLREDGVLRWGKPILICRESVRRGLRRGKA